MTVPSDRPYSKTPNSQALRVCSFESRKADDMRSLIARNGGIATIAPSMREIPLDESREVFTFCETLFSGEIDVVVFMTGVGARALVEAVETRHDRARFLEALQTCHIVIRGPKPAAVLREWGVRIDQRAPEPNTWREIVGLFAVADDAQPSFSISGKTVAVQEYGEPGTEFYAALEDLDAKVVRVPVYRWALPEDTQPLEQSIRDTIQGQFDILMFTSANQLRNVLTVADTLGLRDDWLQAARQCVVASIGPTASETIRAAGLPVDLEPEYGKMGHLVRETLAAAPRLLETKSRSER